ncbi:potassium channel family protein [uncultured Robinsoniella sp.]|uniref:potassium channel family protein n=1 Tax=uncultured Robinsoniella sp. TaxID=904190 RepID=UPI00374EE04D
MKTILIIGMGRFGHHLCINFSKMNNEVMIIDKDEDKVSDLLPYATTAKVGDCTNEEVLRSLGISNFDLCFICIGSNFQSSLEITSLVKEMGGKYVVSKANRDIHAKFLLRNGADEVVYPDRDIAEKIAVRHSANHVFDYVELTEGYSILEIPPLPSWVGKSIKQVDVRAKYHVSILGIKVERDVKLLPHADYILTGNEHLMIIGQRNDIDRILANIQ